MGEDEERERIRSEKLRELQKTSRAKTASPSSETLGKPVDVSDDTVQRFVQEHALAVVDCWAAWCAPCRMVAPVIDELASAYSGRIAFGKLNVDENRDTAMRHQVMSIPTLLVFKAGKLVDRIVGAMPRPLLEPKLTRYLE
jgi:thioredoxin 1